MAPRPGRPGNNSTRQVVLQRPLTLDMLQGRLGQLKEAARLETRATQMPSKSGPNSRDDMAKSNNSQSREVTPSAIAHWRPT